MAKINCGGNTSGPIGDSPPKKIQILAMVQTQAVAFTQIVRIAMITMAGTARGTQENTGIFIAPGVVAHIPLHHLIIAIIMTAG